MEKLVNKGFAKSIGLSNFNKRQIERILKVATVKPVNLQVKYLIFVVSADFKVKISTKCT